MAGRAQPCPRARARDSGGNKRLAPARTAAKAPPGREAAHFTIITPPGSPHTSVALRDPLCEVGIPFVEVHLANIHAREPFRKHSYFSDKAVGVISGLGAQGYQLALEFALARLRASGA